MDKLQKYQKLLLKQILNYDGRGKVMFTSARKHGISELQRWYKVWENYKKLNRRSRNDKTKE